MTIDASKFKATCLELLDDLDPEGVVITKNGKPVARLTAIQSDCAQLIGLMKGKAIIDPGDDLLSTGTKWDSES